MALTNPLAAQAAPFPELPAPFRPQRTVLVTGLASDAHTWNLIFLQRFIEECGHQVVNLGPCVPVGLLVAECLEHAPDLVVISSVNGHGVRDGLAAIRGLRATPALADLPVIIGGKLSTRGRLTDGEVHELAAAGYAAVYADGGLLHLRRLLAVPGSCHALA